MRVIQVLLVALTVAILCSSRTPAAEPQAQAGAESVLRIIPFTHPVVPPQVGTLSDGSPNEVASIPRGDGGVHFRGDTQGSESRPEGPGALAVDGSGGFWILDTVAGRILHVQNGRVTSALDKSGDLSLPVALAVSGPAGQQRLAVLDLGPSHPRVFQYHENGRSISTADLPAEWSGNVQSLVLNEDGTLFLSVVAGDAVGRYRVLPGGARTAYAQVSGLEYFGPENGPGFEPVDPFSRVIEKQWIATTAMGDRLFLIGELSGDANGNMYTDTTLQRMKHEGTMDFARVPVRDQYTLVGDKEGLAVDTNTGGVFVLVPRREGVSIRRLSFVERLKPLPPISRPLEHDTEAGLTAMATGSVTANSITTCEMMAVATTYCVNVAIPAIAVANDSKTMDRKIPKQLATKGGNYAVPYAWGRWDDRAAFAARMSAATANNHYKAGDLNTDRFNSANPYWGTDCSGMVTRVWKLGQKESTSSLPRLSTRPTTFQQGDIMNLSGSHVLLYIDSTAKASPTGTYRFQESVLPYGVRLNSYKLSSLTGKGYVHYRFTNVAPANATCVIPTSCQ